ncbi:DUF983 domain-containing protein [Acidisphaera sp. L21]|uniref:DUF983 domain-containing protein n=1 Tax=Acidisphaera sp. L21 TaxID=1641851 RepID=UPI0020B12A62|nr:DUF983 domain-containing protein [Acidisphaera sp. L21]
MPDTQVPTRWQPNRSPEVPPWPVPPLLVAMGRGARGLCPACGKTHAFIGYLRVVPECAVCGAPLGEVRADDAPPYFTVFIVAHVVITAMFLVYQAYDPPYWVQAAIWLPTTVVMSMGLLRPIKGATLGLMLKLGLMKPAGE